MNECKVNCQTCSCFVVYPYHIDSSQNVSLLHDMKASIRSHLNRSDGAPMMVEGVNRVIICLKEYAKRPWPLRIIDIPLLKNEEAIKLFI